MGHLGKMNKVQGFAYETTLRLPWDLNEVFEKLPLSTFVSKDGSPVSITNGVSEREKRMDSFCAIEDSIKNDVEPLQLFKNQKASAVDFYKNFPSLKEAQQEYIKLGHPE